MLNSLFLLTALSIATPLQDGVTLSREKNYEASEIALKQVESKDKDNTYFYYRLLNSYMLNHKKEGLHWAELLLDPGAFDMHEKPPMRYLVVGSLMENDMKQWKDDKDELDDVSRDMKKISDRLDTGKGGEDTQKIEKDVLARLDKKIKSLEDKKEQQKQQSSSSGKGQKSQDKLSQGQQPADDSNLSQTSGSGVVDGKKMQAVAKEWGKLQPKDRAQAMKELTKDLSPELRDTIERYFAELSKRSD